MLRALCVCGLWLVLVFCVFCFMLRACVLHLVFRALWLVVCVLCVCGLRYAFRGL